MKRAAMNAFRRTPRPLRLLAVHAATPSYTVGVVLALRRDNGDMLFVEQRHTGGWALPGGLLGRGEAAVQGLVREVSEEVGLTMDPLALPVPQASLTPTSRRVDLVFVCSAGDDVAPRRGDDVEVMDVGWFPLGALPEVTEPTLEILRGVRLL